MAVSVDGTQLAGVDTNGKAPANGTVPTSFGSTTLTVPANATGTLTVTPNLVYSAGTGGASGTQVRECDPVTTPEPGASVTVQASAPSTTAQPN